MKIESEKITYTEITYTVKESMKLHILSKAHYGI